MRIGSNLLMLAALSLWLACVAWPTLALLTSIRHTAATHIEMKPAMTVLGTSVGWAMLVAVIAMIVGWVPGRVLGSLIRRRGFVPVAALLLVPICMPAYIVYFAWWQSWPVDSQLHRWVLQHGYMQWARQATLLVGLVCWSWPLVSICVASAAGSRPADRDEMLALDRAGRIARTADRFRTDSRGLLIGGFLVALATLSNTTCFDLAEVFTFANEVRAVKAFGGAGAREVLIAGAPMTMIAIVGAAVLWWLLYQRSQPATLTSRSGWFAILSSASIWLLTVGLPMVLFLRHTTKIADMSALMREFLQLYKWSALNTLALAAVSGALAALITAGLFTAWRDERWTTRCVATLVSVTWIAFSLSPGTTIGVALERAYNMPTIDLIYNQRSILVLGHLSAFGLVAALISRWAAKSTPKTQDELARLDRAQTALAIMQANKPALLAAVASTFFVTLIMGIGEIPVTAMVNPPQPAGVGPLALSLLNDMHYQRPQTVMIAALGIAALAMLVACIVALMWRVVRIIPPDRGRPPWSRHSC